MPLLTSSGTLWVDDRSAATVRALRLRAVSPGIYEFVVAGAADLEMVDVLGDRVFKTVPAGTAPTSRRLVARQLNGGNIIVY